MPIRIQRGVSEAELTRLGARSWPVWEKGVSRFPWTYDSSETCFVLEGQVLVTPDGGEPVTLEAGDLVTFPAGLSCVWDVRVPIRKHYSFG